MTTTPDVISVVAPADHVSGPPQGQWTYKAYAALPDDGQRYEIINGVLYMAPAPNFDHQDSNGEIYAYLRTYVKLQGLGRVIIAPFDVELIPGGSMVQPDISVVLKANESRILPGKIVGPPDLVVEVASPATAGYDRREKQDAYAQAGVPEYWIADPKGQSVEVLVLEQGKYRSLGVFLGQAVLPSQVVQNFPVKVQQFFS